MSPDARSVALCSLTLLCLSVLGCGKATTSAPPPEVVATAESHSRPVTIDAPFATTPIAEAEDKQQPVALSGHVFGSGPVGVILAHMRPADQTAWFPFALQLAATGKFTVLTFDFRGFGDSTGEKEFDHLDTDLTAAYRYMTDDLKIAKIVLVGASMGGTASIVVGSRVRVVGVVSISSAAQFQTLDALHDVASVSPPKLFITSKDDVPAARSEEELWAAASEPKDQEIYSGNAHGTDMFEGMHQTELEQRILAFLERL